MKKLFFLITILFIFSSCNKDENLSGNKNDSSIYSSEQIVSILKSYHSSNDSKQQGPILDKIKKWIKAHVGTHIPAVTCYNSYPCGPCPGICLKLSINSNVVDDNYNLSSSEIENGERLFILAEYDSLSYIITFVNTNDFVYNDEFILEEDVDLGDEVAEAFGKENFILPSGTYPVIYDFDERGETVIIVE